MDKLWAPWRSKYIYLRNVKGCIFCKGRDTKNEKEMFVIEKTKYSFSMLNIYPYNNGHIMVSPKRHVREIDKLTKAERCDLMELVTKSKTLLDRILKPHGYNIGINVGDVGGAGYKGHLHFHIVPRWLGDTNYMPILADTKIISESLDDMYGRLISAKKKRS